MGGAIYDLYPSSILQDCMFIRNTAKQVSAVKIAVPADYSNKDDDDKFLTTLINCYFKENTVSGTLVNGMPASSSCMPLLNIMYIPKL